MHVPDQTLDARGLNCPLPILRTRKALNTMTAGQTLQVIATDPGAVKDISAFCEQTGHRLVSTEQVHDEHIFLIRKL
ncbi:MAG TPA: sulfurtransferase TusA family protein [Gammaproteobacteria bacterium]|nr:sulfurtransferase TusA family protein [Gammaproteobacteria bacterium]